MPVNDWTPMAALLLGLFGSSHCLVMCGGLAAAIGQQQPGRMMVVIYNLGRLVTYALLGLVAGLFGLQFIKAMPGLAGVLRTLAGLMLIAMGCYVSQWWMGLTRLEQLGARLWNRIQPWVSRLIPVKNYRQAFLLGGLWGLLPCGLVYSTLAWSIAVADWRQSAGIMLMFGVGTLPAMMAVGLLNQSLLQRLRQRGVRRLAGVLIIVMGLWTALTPWVHWGHASHPAAGTEQHQHH